MMRKVRILIILTLFSVPLRAQFNGNRFAVAVNAVYTTTARIYLHPYSSDEILRNASFNMEGIVNPSINIRYRLTDDLILGFNTEIMEKTDAGKNLTVFIDNSTETISVNDGFRLIPLELSAYYLLPFSTDKFKFMMGGGGAVYFGSRIRNFGDASVTTEHRKFAYGIQVAVTMDYLISRIVAVRTEMKFRDPQFIVTSKYNEKEVRYNGKIITLAQNTFDSKINVDGVTFIVGLAFNF